MCTDGPCTFPARPGHDIDINGDVWPGSDLERHLAATRFAPTSPDSGREADQ